MTAQGSPQNVADSDRTFSFISSLKDVGRAEWNALLEDDNPFLRHEFLDALERNDCLGKKYGWYPHHLTVRDTDNVLVAAMPLYIKTNSYGEFVFDWAWASAYRQSGLAYYPKLVSSVPYTPVTGARLLVAPHLSSTLKSDITDDMINAATREAGIRNASGMHWLFNKPDECKFFKRQNLMLRLGCQYHWRNRDYESFNHFLESFVSRKRKKVKRERRYVQEQDIQIRRLHGYELDDALWERVHALYASTFYRKSGFPTLSLEFFKELGSTMGSQILLVLAYSDKKLIACAVNFRSSHTLYGRFWGCIKRLNSLHFEACFYQGIEYAIENKLASFEPGAQGEHKIGRGFLPVKTWSAHWIADSRFEPAIRDFCQREEKLMHQECEKLMTLSPYRLE